MSSSLRARSFALPPARARSGPPPGAWLGCLLGALALAGCGNKGPLFLPSSLEDERVLERIDASLGEPAAEPTAEPTRDPSAAPDGTAPEPRQPGERKRRSRATGQSGAGR